MQLTKATTTHSWRVKAKLNPLPHWLEDSKTTSGDTHTAKLSPALTGAQNTQAHSWLHHAKGLAKALAQTSQCCDFYNLQSSCLSFFQQETQACLWRIHFNSSTAFCSLLQKFYFPRQIEIIPKQVQYANFLIQNIPTIPQLQGHLERKQLNFPSSPNLPVFTLSSQHPSLWDLC